ncbi:hypothetical protein ECZU26_50960 [Escherichia coli]|nr:hypothetical protein ECZU26_50960 [Escherichia coli]GHL48677.1 hypothetical protein ECZU29_35270 [Escherichia coli]
MHEIFNMLLAVFDRAALMLICLFFLIRIRLFRELLHKSAHSPKELLAVTAIFSLFALFSTWSGVPVEGSLVNVRIIAVMSGGILFGPWVGIITGVIAGIHRYLIDIGGVTAIPCFITSILAGCISGWINLKIPKAQRWRVGILGGMLCETLTMILVIVWAPTTALGIDIVSKIGIPMILGSVCIGFIVLLVQSVEGEKRPAPRGRPSWRWISPTKRCRCFAMSIASHYAKFVKLSAMIFMPMRWRLPIPIMCWPMLAWVNTTIRMAMTSLARLPDRR